MLNASAQTLEALPVSSVFHAHGLCPFLMAAVPPAPEPRDPSTCVGLCAQLFPPRSLGWVCQGAQPSRGLCPVQREVSGSRGLFPGLAALCGIACLSQHLCAGARPPPSPQMPVCSDNRLPCARGSRQEHARWDLKREERNQSRKFSPRVTAGVGRGCESRALGAELPEGLGCLLWAFLGTRWDWQGVRPGPEVTPVRSSPASLCDAEAGLLWQVF